MTTSRCKSREARLALRFGLAAMVIALLAGCSTIPVAPSGPVGEISFDHDAAQAMISNYRRAHGLSPVELDSALDGVAQRQATAMAAANELSHDVVGSLPERLASRGVDRRAAIENVSAGYSSFPAALSGWERSPHHNDNLLFSPMRRMGIAAASAPGTRYKTFWSLVMTN